jgi:hypothetical protein
MSLRPKLFFVSVFVLCAAAFGQQTAQEKKLVQQLNQSRAQAGLPPLKVDDRLTQAAREHSQRMADRQILGHVLPAEPGVAERLAATGLHFNRSGENVGYNSNFNDLQNAWMHSPPHRENILSPNYTVVGIGVVLGPDNIYWATQDFARSIVERSADEAADLVAQTIQAARQKTRSPIQRIDVSSLEQVACKMARAGKLDPRQVLELPNVRYAITYNNSQPEQLPPSAQDAARQKSVTKFAVGACESTGKSNPGGTYYVALAFY